MFIIAMLFMIFECIWLLSFKLLIISCQFLSGRPPPTCRQSQFTTGNDLRFSCNPERSNLNDTAVMYKHVCNGVNDCANGHDEYDCVSHGVPTAFDSIPNSKLIEKETSSARIIVNWPQYNCSTPICFDAKAPNHLIAHILCKQIGYATFGNFEGKLKPNEVRAIDSGSMQCRGHESSLHTCFKDKISLTKNCPKLLYVTCLQKCEYAVPVSLHKKAGYVLGYDVKNPGFPNFILPNLNCKWVIDSIDDCRFRISFISLNLLPSSEHSLQKEKPLMINSQTACHSYVSIIDGNNETKVCELENRLKNMTTKHRNITIKYVNTGPFDPDQTRGFHLKFESIKEIFKPPEAKSIPMWIQIVFPLLAVFAVLFLLGCCCWICRKRDEKRRSQKVAQWQTINSRRNNALVRRLADALGTPAARKRKEEERITETTRNIPKINVNEHWANTPIDKLNPLYCPTCDTAGYRPGDQGCVHTRKMQNYLPKDYLTKDPFALMKPTGMNFKAPMGCSKTVHAIAELPPSRKLPQMPLPNVPGYLHPAVNQITGWSNVSRPSEDSGPYDDLSNNSSKKSTSIDPTTGEPLYLKVLHGSASSSISTCASGNHTIPDSSHTVGSLHLSVTLGSPYLSDNGEQFHWAGASLYRDEGATNHLLMSDVNNNQLQRNEKHTVLNRASSWSVTSLSKQSLNQVIKFGSQRLPVSQSPVSLRGGNVVKMRRTISNPLVFVTDTSNKDETNIYPFQDHHFQ